MDVLVTGHFGNTLWGVLLVGCFGNKRVKEIRLVQLFLKYLVRLIIDFDAVKLFIR